MNQEFKEISELFKADFVTYGATYNEVRVRITEFLPFPCFQVPSDFLTYGINYKPDGTPFESGNFLGEPFVCDFVIDTIHTNKKVVGGFALNRANTAILERFKAHGVKYLTPRKSPYILTLPQMLQTVAHFKLFKNTNE